MRSTVIPGLVVGLSALWVGCGHRENASPKGPTAEDASPNGPTAPAQAGFAGRLDAAKAIGDPVSRDRALIRLASDAAAGSDGETARKAVEAIGDQVMKDRMASRSALQLGKAGKGRDANALARLIGDPVLRDRTLGKIATGEFGD
jgi:hypothetical protein